MGFCLFACLLFAFTDASIPKHPQQCLKHSDIRYMFLLILLFVRIKRQVVRHLDYSPSPIFLFFFPPVIAEQLVAEWLKWGRGVLTLAAEGYGIRGLVAERGEVEEMAAEYRWGQMQNYWGAERTLRTLSNWGWGPWLDYCLSS